MKTFLGSSLASVLLTSLALAQGSPRVWIVGSFGGPDVDYLEIQLAVDAAADGDTILVREGTYYEGFEIVDKALVVAAHPPGSVRFAFDDADRIRVAGLAAEKSVQLHGLGTQASTYAPPSLVLEENLGVVWLEDCSFAADVLVFGSLAESEGVSIVDSEDVVLLGCTITGYPAMRVAGSSFHMYDCRVESLEALASPLQGIPGIELSDSSAFLSGSTVAGGGRDPTQFSCGLPFCIGNGGAGIELSNGSELYLQDSQLTGGAVDTASGQFGCIIAGCPGAPVGVSGPPIASDASSTVTPLDGISHRYETSPIVREGELRARTFQGAPGESVFLVQGPGPFVYLDLLLSGSVLVGSAEATVTPVGSLDAAGTLQLTETLADLGPATSFSNAYEQGLFWDIGGSGMVFAGGGGAALLLDASFSGPVGRDCNQNGFDDDEDLLSGSSLDCNQNGTPDECERFSATEVDRLLASDGANLDAFGYALARDGDTLVVGAPQDKHVGSNNEAGSVYVFERQASGWTQVQKVLPTSLSGLLRFGHSLDVEGDVLVVGAPDSFVIRGAFQRVGAAYVFERTAGVWSQAAQLVFPTQPNGTLLTGMGWEVALEDGTIAIGSEFESYVVLFEKVAGTWQAVQTLVEFSGACCTSGYGRAIVMEGDTLVIGAPGHGLSDGRAFVYERAAGIWQPADVLAPTISGTKESFGTSVAIEGDSVLVGAPDRDHAAAESGVAYAFRRLPDGSFDLDATVRMAPVEGASRDEFGNELAAASGLAVISQLEDSEFPQAGRETLFVFQRDALGSWERFERAAFFPADWDENDDFGRSLLLDGASVLAGAPSWANGPGAKTGAVYVFDLADVVVPNPCLLDGPRPFGERGGFVPRPR